MKKIAIIETAGRGEDASRLTAEQQIHTTPPSQRHLKYAGTQPPPNSNHRPNIIPTDYT